MDEADLCPNGKEVRAAAGVRARVMLERGRMPRAPVHMLPTGTPRLHADSISGLSAAAPLVLPTAGGYHA